MKITHSTDDQLMCLAAFRYCLGRQTYIVRSCIDWLYVHWEQFTNQTKTVIVRDIIEAIYDNRCGSETIDKPYWVNFVKWSYNNLKNDNKEWVKNALSHKLDVKQFIKENK